MLRPRGRDLFLRLLSAAAGLLAGLAALLLVLYPYALALFWLYAIFSAAGWVIVGLPIVFFLPSALWARLPWPVVAGIGIASGPFALLLIIAALFVFQGRIGDFSLDHTESYWLFSTLVSTVTVLVYAALLRWRSHQPK